MNLWDEQEEFLDATAKNIEPDKKGKEVIDEIMRQIQEILTKGFEPAFIIMNTRNYERIVVWGVDNGLNGHAPDKLFGLTLVVWDVPIDYVNVKCKASVEWAYGEGIHKNEG